MRFWSKSLMVRLVTSFLALSAIGVTIIALISLVIVRNALTQSIYERLGAVATLKEDELDRWVDEQRNEVAAVAQLPNLALNLRLLWLIVDPSNQPLQYEIAHDYLAELLKVEVENNPSFQEMFILSSVGGKILVSTSPENEGQYRVSDTYYTEGRKDVFVQNVYISPQTSKPAMTISSPVFDESGNLLGVVAAHIDIERLDQLILQRAGLGETGETYLVDRFNNFVSAPRFGNREFPRGVHTEGIDAALEGNDHFGLYTNYENVPVIGVYRWLDEQEMAFMAEISQEEAFAPARRLALAILGSGLAVAIVMVFGVFVLARQIARPILAISATAEKVASGNLEVAAPILTQDEIGTLAGTFNSMAAQLKKLIVGLEQRVADRTKELESANRYNERRAKQFEAVAQVARTVASIQDLDVLLPRITHVISQQFGFYHVGIFLLDDSLEFAVLMAANSEGGKRMLAREHKLRVGQTGIVGYTTGTGKPRIALNTGTDKVFFNNPDLPETRSEIALPLLVGEKIIGALDVQSTEPNAFESEDIEVLSTLADQVSIAIQNARSFRETHKLLAEAQVAVSGYIKEAWKVLQPTILAAGYQNTGTMVQPLEKPLEGEHIRQAIELGKTTVLPSKLAIPIRLRGQVIGVMNLQVPENHEWISDEVDIVEAIAERLSLAIESATLLQATQRRADIERVTADISGKISSSTQFETILKTTAEELSRALGGSDVLVQIEPISMKMSSSA